MSDASPFAGPAAAAEAALDRFPSVRGYLDTATSGVPPLVAIAAAREAVTAWAEGRLDGAGFDLAVDRSRAAFARLVGTHRARASSSRCVEPA